MSSSSFRNLMNTKQFRRQTGWVFGWVLGLAVLGSVAPVALAEIADHLVLSEFLVKTRDPVSTFGSPFFEVTNPTSGDIDMSQVYLTDGTTSPTAFYYYITLTDPEASNPGGGNGGDFHAKFPDGFILGAGQTLVISLNGSSEYFEAYGRNPDFELFEDGSLPDEVPELVEAYPGSINAGPLSGDNIPALSDVAESLMLYQWDGSSDLVQDLDYVMWGTNESVRVDKTGVTIGSGTYLADTPVGDQDPVDDSGPRFGHSFQRVSTDEGSEFLTGGNGLTGHDETSEDLSVTWADVSPGDPATGLPESYPSAPIVEALVANAVSGVDIPVSATVLTFGTMDSVDFYYSVDGGAYATVAGMDAQDGRWTASLPAQAAGAMISIYCVATNAEGGTATYPAAAPTFGAETIPVSSPPGKLLITEVSTGVNIYPYEGMQQIAMEFIEIHNPNDYEVDLSDYYLTDAINYYLSTQVYWNIAQGNPRQSSIGGGHYNDFVARFPDAFLMPAGATITVSMAGSDWFEAFFGISPTLEMYEDGTEPDEIPDMRPVFDNPPDDEPGNSIYTEGRDSGNDELPRGIPELEEYYGEPLILYHYIEGEDLVTDIDVFMWGNEKTGDRRIGFDKTGESNGASAYVDDTDVADQDWFTPVIQSDVKSYTRVDAEEGWQSQGVGNGVAGRDETSENWNETFDTLSFTPGVFLAGGGGSDSAAQINIPAKTFNPTMGDRFPIEFVSNNDSETRLRIFDREGRLVITLFDSRSDGPASSFPEFPNRVNWDGRDDTYELVPAGMYVLHLSIVNNLTGDEDTKTAPVVVATRLSK